MLLRPPKISHGLARDRILASTMKGRNTNHLCHCKACYCTWYIRPQSTPFRKRNLLSFSKSVYVCCMWGSDSCSLLTLRWSSAFYCVGKVQSSECSTWQYLQSLLCLQGLNALNSFAARTVSFTCWLLQGSLIKCWMSSLVGLTVCGRTYWYHINFDFSTEPTWIFIFNFVFLAGLGADGSQYADTWHCS